MPPRPSDLASRQKQLRSWPHLVQRVHHALPGAVTVALMRQQHKAGGAPVALQDEAGQRGVGCSA